MTTCQWILFCMFLKYIFINYSRTETKPFVLFLSCFFSSSRSFLSAPCRVGHKTIIVKLIVGLLLVLLSSSRPHLVTEDLDLTEGPVDRLAAAAAVAVGVDLDYQRHALHPLLGREVRAQAVHRDKDLRKRK